MLSSSQYSRQTVMIAAIILAVLFSICGDNNKCIGVDGFAPSQPLPSPTTTITLQPDHHQNRVSSTKLFVERGIDPDQDETDGTTTPPPSALWATLTNSGPPLRIDDAQVLLYDVFLLVNLSVSISFLVTHRMNVAYLPAALNEGTLLSICWIIAGLANGSFLYSAVDGHYDPYDGKNEGGPKAAGLLALSTFVSTCSLRIIMALGAAVMQHRMVGIVGGEELMPLEILFGLVLMSVWRFFHSANTLRM
mmetsp:Transcript_20878/g.43571  ORF Transcript_20878/g.43571 Transcript_20878/m.43571 type:complete len:249 (-) Transcript_20878:360-1106(-)